MQLARKKIRKYVCGDESRRVRDHLREKSRKPEYLKLMDKISFTMGVLNISICQYFLFNQPKAFWIWFSVVIPILMYSRLKHFRRKGWHYFLLDFCYFTILSTFVHLYFTPHSLLLFRIIFIYANGPLTWAIVLWRSSFVFHDYDKITSVYIHILPSILTFTEKWNEDSLYSTTQSLHFADYLAAALGYLFWQFFYFIKTEHLDKAKLDQNPSLVTSLRWLSKDDKNFTAKKVLLLLRKCGVFGPTEKYDSTTLKTKCVFVAFQFIYTLVSFIPTYALYNSQRLHLFFIASIMITSIYFGAGYYIEVFAERYHLEFMAKPSLSPTTAEMAYANIHTNKSDAATLTGNSHFEGDFSGSGHDSSFAVGSDDASFSPNSDDSYEQD